MTHRTPTRDHPSDSHQAPRRVGEPRPARRRWGVIGGASAAAIVVVVVLVAALTGHPAGPAATTASTTAGAGAGQTGPEGVPLETGTPLAPASTSATGQTVDGIRCDASEQVAYHVHTHLSIYVDGQLRPLPAGVGAVEPIAEQTAAGEFDGASRCYYWLHVHAQDGIIHIESPTSASYTLGQFFDLWGQPLGAGQVGPATGPLTVFVDGRAYGGDPRTIVLGSHSDVQIDVGSPVRPPMPVDWSRSQL